MQYEWATNGADILWRRSKLGPHLAPDTEARLDTWMTDKAIT
jgi:glycerol-3-phosphate dehydrogenase